VTFTNVPVTDANANAGDNDTLTFFGTDAVDLIQINLAAAGTSADPILRFSSPPLPPPC